MIRTLTMLCCYGLATLLQQQADPFQPVRFMIGSWKGTAEGQSGTGAVERTYTMVLTGRYIQETNVSVYPKERHEHISFISYDSNRKLLVLRQFHQEGFVNRYVLKPELSSERKIVFESESFENFDNSWKARETYEILSPNEFVEIFELAPPGKPYELYSKNHFKRTK